jgi:hypothetical protein
MSNRDMKGPYCHSPPDPAAVAEQLRRLPQPPVPATLERRLLDAIPANDSRRWHWAAPRAVAAGLAAAAALVVSLRLLRPPEEQGAPPTDHAVAAAQPDTAPGTILPRADLTETRPCDILPPLSYSWRRP